MTIRFGNNVQTFAGPLDPQHLGAVLDLAEPQMADGAVLGGELDGR
jgi:hypothetical protein